LTIVIILVILEPEDNLKGAKMKTFAFLLIIGLTSIQALGHATYTGYSGAPGRQTCSRSCHPMHNMMCTITVTGFPQTYVPGQQYSIAVAHNGGTTIANFNASVRIGTGSVNAGTIATSTNTSTYNVSGETNGVHFGSANQNSGVFLWTAPAAGTGVVRLYWAGLQGNHSTGADTVLTLLGSENLTGIDDNANLPQTLELAQNYPNPFNAETIISFSLSQPGHVELSISNILGQRIYNWADDIDQAGTVSMRWNGRSNEGMEVPSGVYFYQLQTSEGRLTRQMTFLK
jgi:hypothetical protein